jgi:hypothetical protein
VFQDSNDGNSVANSAHNFETLVRKKAIVRSETSGAAKKTDTGRTSQVEQTTVAAIRKGVVIV